MFGSSVDCFIGSPHSLQLLNRRFNPKPNGVALDISFALKDHYPCVREQRCIFAVAVDD
jgi:hypothetical protein